jgi:hypothetical protein
MTTPSYVLLEKITVGAGGASSVTFSSIPQTGYTDLVMKMSARTDKVQKQENIQLYFNTVNTDFSFKMLIGDGSAASSYGTTNSQVADVPAATMTANTFGNMEIYIPNYVGSTYKSISVDSVDEGNQTTVYSYLTAALWSNTAAITEIKIAPAGANNFVQYSTFYLYGVAKLGTTPAIVPYATGGDTIMTDGTYWYHAFLSSGTFTPAKGLSCDVLVVAGGGASGRAGGGAGGLVVTSSASFASGTAYTTTVGAGGTAGAGNTQGGNGSNSNVTGGSLSLTAAVGGGGGGAGLVSVQDGLSGGSGGGEGYGRGTGSVGTGTSGQGNNGGLGYSDLATYTAGGGGGGAGAVGGAASSAGGGTSGAGGSGSNTYSSWLSATGTGVSSYIAGGGAGGIESGKTLGAAGSGGGGAGGLGATGNAATANTGGGAGGGGNGQGANGGSGLVIVRYAV